MRNLELPTPISPCLRIFIESLLDESTATVPRRAYQKRELHCTHAFGNGCFKNKQEKSIQKGLSQ